MWLYAAVAFLLVVMLLTESFPADVQATSTAVIESIGQVGGALGPILINYCIQWQIHPLIALSIMALLLIVIPFFWMEDPQELMKIDVESTQESLID